LADEMKNNIPLSYYQSARWMYKYLHDKDISEQTKLAWGKVLYKISTKENNRDLYLIESLFVWSQFDERWKTRINSPQKIDDHFDAIAHNACDFITDETLSEILALLYVYGGEYTVYNLSFRFYLPLAKWRFNFWGGERPKAEGVEMINQKIYELERLGDKVSWFPMLLNSITNDHLPKSFEQLHERFYSHKDIGKD